MAQFQNPNLPNPSWFRIVDGCLCPGAFAFKINLLNRLSADELYEAALLANAKGEHAPVFHGGHIGELRASTSSVKGVDLSGDGDVDAGKESEAQGDVGGESELGEKKDFVSEKATSAIGEADIGTCTDGKRTAAASAKTDSDSDRKNESKGNGGSATGVATPARKDVVGEQKVDSGEDKVVIDAGESNEAKVGGDAETVSAGEENAASENEIVAIGEDGTANDADKETDDVKDGKCETSNATNEDSGDENTRAVVSERDEKESLATGKVDTSDAGGSSVTQNINTGDSRLNLNEVDEENVVESMENTNDFAPGNAVGKQIASNDVSQGEQTSPKTDDVEELDGESVSSNSKTTNKDSTTTNVRGTSASSGMCSSLNTPNVETSNKGHSAGAARGKELSVQGIAVNVAKEAGVTLTKQVGVSFTESASITSATDLGDSSAKKVGVDSEEEIHVSTAKDVGMSGSEEVCMSSRPSIDGDDDGRSDVVNVSNDEDIALGETAKETSAKEIDENATKEVGVTLVTEVTSTKDIRVRVAEEVGVSSQEEIGVASSKKVAMNGLAEEAGVSSTPSGDDADDVTTDVVNVSFDEATALGGESVTATADESFDDNERPRKRRKTSHSVEEVCFCSSDTCVLVVYRCVCVHTMYPIL